MKPADWWMVFIGAIITVFLAWWAWDSYCYDKDLEKDFIRETGMTWRQAEKSVFEFNDKNGGGS